MSARHQARWAALFAARCAGAGAAIRAGNHGVSDPAARARCGPAPVRRGRSRHGCLCRFRVWEAASSAARSAACLLHRPRSIATQIFRTIWSRSSGKCWPQIGRVHARLPGQFRPGNRGFKRACIFDVGLRSRGGHHTWNHVDASAITAAMLHLCSAPCKALRFAPPAHARGLRALTVPARR